MYCLNHRPIRHFALRAFLGSLAVLASAGVLSSLWANDEAKQNFPGERLELVEQIDLFARGQGGYHTYRIPSLIATKEGALLALCEGRKDGGGDSGNIDLIARRSTDGGKTWSEPQVIWDDAGNTCGNPCPVVDGKTGTIWLLMTHNVGRDTEQQIIEETSRGTRTVWIMQSDDEGKSWSEPREITSTTKRDDWTWYATGPGAGIQLERGDHAGRLVIPCDHIEAKTKGHYSHVIYSDDGGKSWRLGGRTPQPWGNECEVVELADGALMLNVRNYNREEHRKRGVCVSRDGGDTWSDISFDHPLIEPRCQASIRRYSWPDKFAPSRILFSNPASETERHRLTVRMSYDEGQTWPADFLLHEGPAAYSSLAALPSGEMGCLYERGEKNPYENVTFARLKLVAVED